MNILNFIDNIDLATINKFNEMPIPFRLINLHTRNLERAKSQCDNFFRTKQEFVVVVGVEVKQSFFYYTDSSDYQWYGGWKYELIKSSNGIY